MKDKFLRELEAFINKIAFGTTYSRMPRFRYFIVKGDRYAFAWTTQRCSDGKFYALKYRITKKAWKLVKKVAFGRRKIAKSRAHAWYQKRKEKVEQDVKNRKT